MRKTHILIIGIVLYGIIGDLYFRDFFRTTGIIITVLFILFLIIHSWMDKRKMFVPNKRDKES